MTFHICKINISLPNTQHLIISNNILYRFLKKTLMINISQDFAALNSRRRLDKKTKYLDLANMTSVAMCRVTHSSQISAR